MVVVFRETSVAAPVVVTPGSVAAATAVVHLAHSAAIVRAAVQTAPNASHFSETHGAAKYDEKGGPSGSAHMRGSYLAPTPVYDGVMQTRKQKTFVLDILPVPVKDVAR
jgi:hypothetical protein